MAAGSAGASGRNSGSSPALESTLDRRFQTVNNTMESIQGLSVWCIENKKYHSVIVRYWIKWLRKSDSSHRLNLFYLANDVIQNCKRKNAIVYRTTFTDVLPEAIKLISSLKDSKVTKSVERILNIWEERNVYTEEFIHQLKNGMVQSQTEEPVKAPDNSRAALKSKIVAEFVPSAFIEHLSNYRKSVDEAELKEKQLAAMRVDVCSTEALKKLKDKAGGKRFSKDFEDGSTKLQDFVSFLDGEVKKGPPLMEALENADIFYEMQYKEVKIVAKAYETFANRVSHLKRKLDALKAMLPDPNDSPVPSPIEDAPSPSGSVSPFHSLDNIGSPDPELDGQEMDDDMIDLADAPSPLSSVGGSPKPSAPVGDADNRDVEDMELSDVEDTETPTIIVEECVAPPVVSKESSATQNITETSQADSGAQTKQVTTPTTPIPSATQSLPVNLASVDLGKISSILSTLTNVMKNSAVGVSPVSRSSPSVPSAPGPTQKPLTTTAPPVNPLVNILSKVDINPNALLSVLSKAQPHGGLQGLSSLLSNQTAKTATPTSDSDRAPQIPLLTAHTHASPNVTPTPSAVQLSRDPASQGSMAPRSSQSDMLNDKVNPDTSLNSTLDSKIDNFLQGNQVLKGFNLGFPSVLPWPKGTVDSPLASTENLAGTPVRDEGGSTPTQDEMMDVPVPRSEPSLYQQRQSTDAKSTLPHTSWQEPNPQAVPIQQSGTESHQTIGQTQNDSRNSVLSLAEAEAKRHQLIEAILSTPSNQQPSGQSMTGPGPLCQEPRQTPVISNVGPNSELAKSSLYVDAYRDGQEQQMLASSNTYGAEPYHVKEPSHQGFAPPNFLNTPLPPIPNLPPPPQDFPTPASSSMVSGPHVTVEEPFSEAVGGGADESYIPENSGYGEHLAHDEPFQPYEDGPSHFAPEQHHVPKIHSNAPVDYNHQNPMGVPLQHPPTMPHHRMGSPPPVRGYHEGLSPPRPIPGDPYFDPYYDRPPRSPSPPHYDMHLVSPHAHEYYPEDIPPHYPEDLPPHYPERRVPSHLGHRPRLPHHVRPPHPGHYPPPRPLHRPPPVPYAHEPPFPRGKRPGPHYGGPPRGPYYPPKRPFLPPHY